MGETELKTALRRDGEDRMRRLWQQSEEVVDQRRKEIETEVEHLRQESERSVQAEITALRTNLMFEANTRAMECRLHAEAALEGRLLELAKELISELPGDSRKDLWQSLCRELPDEAWETVTTHPADQSRAKLDFPTAVIEGDDSISGGLIATAADGAILVDNTLRNRLLRVWPELLPKLMMELRAKVNNDDPACNDTTV